MSLQIQCSRCLSADGKFRSGVPGSLVPTAAYCDVCWEEARKRKAVDPGVICYACKAQGDWRHTETMDDGTEAFLCDACFSRGDDAKPHPAYYGGADNPYEAIKVIRAWGLNFALGNVLKYVRRCDEKGGLDDLRKARTYLDEEIAAREGKA